MPRAYVTRNWVQCVQPGCTLVLMDGTQIRARIIELELTISKTAEAAEISRFRLSRLLHGRSRANARERRRLAEVLDLPMGEVLPRRSRRGQS